MLPRGVRISGDSGLLSTLLGDSGLPYARPAGTWHVITPVSGTVKASGFLTEAPVWVGASHPSRLGVVAVYWATCLREITPRPPHPRCTCFFQGYWYPNTIALSRLRGAIYT